MTNELAQQFTDALNDLCERYGVELGTNGYAEICIRQQPLPMPLRCLVHDDEGVLQ